MKLPDKHKEFVVRITETQRTRKEEVFSVFSLFSTPSAIQIEN